MESKSVYLFLIFKITFFLFLYSQRINEEEMAQDKAIKDKNRIIISESYEKGYVN